MKIKGSKSQIIFLCSSVTELVSSLGWSLFPFINNGNQLLLYLGAQAIYNLFYQEYLWNICGQKRHSFIWKYRLIYTITVLGLLCNAYYFYVNKINDISSIERNIIAILLLLSLLLWSINTLFSLFRVTERAVRIGTIVAVIGFMLGLFEMALNALRVQFTESVIVIIFLMKIVSFSIKPKNAKFLYKCKLSSLSTIQKYSDTYRKKFCSLIDLLILSMTAFRFVCKRTILNTFIFKFGYFPYIHMPGFNLTNDVTFLVNVSINTVIYSLMIAAIGIIICIIGMLINWLYSRFTRVLRSIRV